jgi:hypothetical protein
METILVRARATQEGAVPALNRYGARTPSALAWTRWHAVSR